MNDSTSDISRLPLDADSLPAVQQYYETRARQFLHDDVRWSAKVEWAEGYQGRVAETHFWRQADPRKVYTSFYLLASARGCGLIRELVKRAPILTTHSCNITAALLKLKADFVVVAPLLDRLEYNLISALYGDTQTARSHRFLMDHIDEGLAVMRKVGASDRAMRAYCLHPLMQNDTDLTQNFDCVESALRDAPDGTATLALAMEYRSVANEYLARVALPAGGIRLSPLKDVNDMLIADKVQNRKDFELYHQATHANSARLTEYFTQWCERLGISESRYQELIADLPR